MVDIPTDTVAPAYGDPMPDMVRASKQVFRMEKHIWRRDLERVVWMEIVDDVDSREWKPDLLEEDYCRFGGAKKVRQILTVSPKSFQVEGEH